MDFLTSRTCGFTGKHRTLWEFVGDCWMLVEVVVLFDWWWILFWLDSDSMVWKMLPAFGILVNLGRCGSNRMAIAWDGWEPYYERTQVWASCITPTSSKEVASPIANSQSIMSKCTKRHCSQARNNTQNGEHKQNNLITHLWGWFGNNPWQKSSYRLSLLSDAFSVFLLTSLFVELKMCLFCQSLINPGMWDSNFLSGRGAAATSTRGGHRLVQGWSVAILDLWHEWPYDSYCEYMIYSNHESGPQCRVRA